MDWYTVYIYNCRRLSGAFPAFGRETTRTKTKSDKMTRQPRRPKGQRSIFLFLSSFLDARLDSLDCVFVNLHILFWCSCHPALCPRSPLHNLIVPNTPYYCTNDNTSVISSRSTSISTNMCKPKRWNTPCWQTQRLPRLSRRLQRIWKPDAKGKVRQRDRAK